jgi:hypothetical protein
LAFPELIHAEKILLNMVLGCLVYVKCWYCKKKKEDKEPSKLSKIYYKHYYFIESSPRKEYKLYKNISYLCEVLRSLPNQKNNHVHDFEAAQTENTQQC